MTTKTIKIDDNTYIVSDLSSEIQYLIYQYDCCNQQEQDLKDELFKIQMAMQAIKSNIVLAINSISNQI